MPISAPEIHQVASRLFFQQVCSDAEHTHRAALNRAYYAAYHMVREMMRVKWSDPQYDPGHAGLTTWLEDSDIEYLLPVGTKLAAIRRKRNRADYILDDTITKSDGGSALNDVSGFLRDIDRIRASIMASSKPKPPHVGLH